MIRYISNKTIGAPKKERRLFFIRQKPPAENISAGGKIIIGL